MAKINGCLKCVFIFFNVLFAILGCVLIFLAVKSTGYSQQMSSIGGPSVGWNWVFAIAVLGISCLGIYAGCSEKLLALKIFAGLMGAGMIIMLIFGILVVVMRNKFRDALQGVESAKTLLDNESMRELVDEMQMSLQCCGLNSVEDWGQDIPTSCQCTPSSEGHSFLGQGVCKRKPQGASGPDQIYKQTCSELIYAVIGFVSNIMMGMFFTFAVTALLGLLVSILMIYQVKRADSTQGGSIAMKGY